MNRFEKRQMNQKEVSSSYLLVTPINSKVIAKQYTMSQITQTKRRIGIAQFLVNNRHGCRINKACTTVFFWDSQA
jgi:hypothetical protein